MSSDGVWFESGRALRGGLELALRMRWFRLVAQLRRKGDDQVFDSLKEGAIQTVVEDSVYFYFYFLILLSFPLL